MMTRRLPILHDALQSLCMPVLSFRSIQHMTCNPEVGNCQMQNQYSTCMRRPLRAGTVVAARRRASRCPQAPLDWGPAGAAGRHAARSCHRSSQAHLAVYRPDPKHGNPAHGAAYGISPNQDMTTEVMVHGPSPQAACIAGDAPCPAEARRCGEAGTLPPRSPYPRPVERALVVVGAAHEDVLVVHDHHLHRHVSVSASCTICILWAGNEAMLTRGPRELSNLG